jgi:DNA-binding Xre family transcriptional regulator
MTAAAINTPRIIGHAGKTMRINPKPIFLAMLENDETRESICGKAKISRDTLRKIENGQLVQLQSIKKLCLSLGIKPKDVIFNAATPTQTQRPEVLGDRRGKKENTDRDNKQELSSEGA